ncbi:MAG: hypothetical protein CM15mP120_08110 [Pseudomonadota bacterium]|nr:MAG: hypothetical protein CM15mP120_08110 [Pseudomonadota bacterium]
MRELYLTYAETRRLHGQDSYNRPSRFFEKFPRSYCRRFESVAVPNHNSVPQHRHRVMVPGACCRIRRVLMGFYGSARAARQIWRRRDFTIRRQWRAGQGPGEFCEGAKWLMVSYANLQILDA